MGEAELTAFDEDEPMQAACNAHRIPHKPASPFTAHRGLAGCSMTNRVFIISLEGEHVHALRNRERGCFLVVQTLWAEKIQSTTDAGSLNTFG